MRLRKYISPHLPIAVTLLALAGCSPSTPDYCCVREDNAGYDMSRLENNVDLPSRPLILQEIVDIAIARNLDVQLQKLEEITQCERVFAEKLKELPDLDLNGEFSNRNNDPAWFSRTVNPGGSRKAQPGPIGPLASQSTSRYYRYMDAALAISVIDFGLSYVRSRQEKNRLLLLKQKNMRARQNLVLDIYKAYYRAIVAQQAISEANVLITALQERQQNLEEQIKRQLVSEMKGLVNQNRLIDMQVKLFAFENEYRSAMTELAGLMGVPPGQKFELAPVEVDDIEITQFNMKDLENVALRYRPELLAQDMQYQVDSDEVRAAIIQMFPNARLFSGLYHQDDPFMYNHDWVKFGTNLSWNFLELPAQWKQMDVAKFRKRIAWETRLSMSMGILTQVHLSHINVMETALQYKISKDLYEVKNRQLTVARVLEAGGEMSSDDVIVFDVETLFARVNAIKAYSNLQIALEQLSNAVGRPLLFSGLADEHKPCGLEQRCEFAGLIGVKLDNVQHIRSNFLDRRPSRYDNRPLDREAAREIQKERRRIDGTTPSFDPLTGRAHMQAIPRRGSLYYKKYLASLKGEELNISDRTLFDEEQDERSQSFFYGENPGEEGGRFPSEDDQVPQEEYDPPGREGEPLVVDRTLFDEEQNERSQSFFYGESPGEEGGRFPSEDDQVPQEEYDPPGREGDLSEGGAKNLGQQPNDEVTDRKQNLYDQQRTRRSRSPSAVRDSASEAHRIYYQDVEIDRQNQSEPLQDGEVGPDEEELTTGGFDRDNEKPTLYDQQRNARSRSPSATRDSSSYRNGRPRYYGE